MRAILYTTLPGDWETADRALTLFTYTGYELIPPAVSFQEVRMSRQSPNSQDRPVADDQRQVLAKLQRLYGRRSVVPDLFGRRPALPSEIERLAKGEQQSQDLPTQPPKTGRQRQKKCG
jgi:hypothetical protein